MRGTRSQTRAARGDVAPSEESSVTAPSVEESVAAGEKRKLEKESTPEQVQKPKKRRGRPKKADRDAKLRKLPPNELASVILTEWEKVEKSVDDAYIPAADEEAPEQAAEQQPDSAARMEPAKIALDGEEIKNLPLRALFRVPNLVEHQAAFNGAQSTNEALEQARLKGVQTENSLRVRSQIRELLNQTNKLQAMVDQHVMDATEDNNNDGDRAGQAAVMFPKQVLKELGDVLREHSKLTGGIVDAWSKEFDEKLGADVKDKLRIEGSPFVQALLKGEDLSAFMSEPLANLQVSVNGNGERDGAEMMAASSAAGAGVELGANTARAAMNAGSETQSVKSENSFEFPQRTPAKSGRGRGGYRARGRKLPKIVAEDNDAIEAAETSSTSSSKRGKPTPRGRRNLPRISPPPPSDKELELNYHVEKKTTRSMRAAAGGELLSLPSGRRY